MSNTSTAGAVTTYGRTPKWIIRHKGLSMNAKAVYAALMLRADNETLECWPSRETLADDLGTSVPTLKRALKELEDAGAIVVTRRKIPGTKSNASNLYRMIFDEPATVTSVEKDTGVGSPVNLPRVTGEPRGGVTGEPVSKPMVTIPSEQDTYTAISSPCDIFSPLSSLPSESADCHQAQFIDGKIVIPDSRRAGFRQMIQEAGAEKAMNGDWGDYWKLWQEFAAALSDYIYGFDLSLGIEIGDLVANKWDVSADVSYPYEAGAELNKILSTAVAAVYGPQAA